MSFFKRLFKIGQAHANKAVEQMEDPSVMLDQAIRDQESTLADNRETLRNMLASVKELEAKATAETKSAEEWNSRAEQALRRGNEDLATKALTRAEEFERSSAAYSKQHASLDREYQGLREAVSKMEADLNETKRTKDTIIAQAKTAEAVKEIHEARAKIGANATDGSAALIDRMRAKADRLSAEADASQEMAAETGDSLENEFAELEAPSASVDARLAALKNKIGSES